MKPHHLQPLHRSDKLQSGNVYLPDPNSVVSDEFGRTIKTNPCYFETNSDIINK